MRVTSPEYGRHRQFGRFLQVSSQKPGRHPHPTPERLIEIDLLQPLAVVHLLGTVHGRTKRDGFPVRCDLLHARRPPLRQHVVGLRDPQFLGALLGFHGLKGLCQTKVRLNWGISYGVVLVTSPNLGRHRRLGHYLRVTSQKYGRHPHSMGSIQTESISWAACS